MALHIDIFTFNPFQENTYIISDDQKNCVIIDPGCYEEHEEEALLTFINKRQLKPLALLNTHAHIDHVLGNSFVLDKFKIDHYLHSEDLITLNSVPKYAHLYGFAGYKPSPQPNKILKGGEKLVFGEIELDVFFTPGHAPGHVVFYNAENNFVINGDVLFRGSYGRVDLPGGSMEVLKKTITEIMFHLPEETVVHCGHGPSTAIGIEKRTNYILQE
jgi:glyoxylase-like metal-dependent hydrolase (beta-lactamase superfamily II)